MISAAEARQKTKAVCDCTDDALRQRFSDWFAQAESALDAAVRAKAEQGRYHAEYTCAVPLGFITEPWEKMLREKLSGFHVKLKTSDRRTGLEQHPVSIAIVIEWGSL